VRATVFASSLAVLLLTSAGAAGQELEPGTYQNAPVGINAFFLNYVHSEGNVLVDATLPIEGANAKVHVYAIGYLRGLNLFGKSAKFDVGGAVSHANFQGFVAGEFRTRQPTGLTDPRVRLLVNLIGAPALDLPAFARYRQRTIVGVSLQAALPFGQYDETKLINLGSNRWSFRPEIGISHLVRRVTLEASGGSWIFTANDANYGGTTLEQRALYFLKGDVIYTFRRNLWVSANYGRAKGGETIVDGVLKNDLQTNDRGGITASVPLTKASALRFAYTNGLTTRLGADFNSIAVGYQYSWGGARPRPAP